MPATTDARLASLALRLGQAPVTPEDPRTQALLAEIIAVAASQPDLADLARLLHLPRVGALLCGLFTGSPYLTALVRRDLARLQRVLVADPEHHIKGLGEAFATEIAAARAQADVLRLLRVYKTEAALLTALCDLGGVWSVMQVTEVLSTVADRALAGAVAFLFRQAVEKGDWIADGTASSPDAASGFFVLGMGKYGARELNYSSDIDLIVFYDRARMRVRPDLDPQTFFVRLTRTLASLLQERTADGYVFRVDLRLRPDAGATQVALSTDAALDYYESVGQNWERAAFIKARAVAGDIAVGEAFLAALQPFVWRRTLDFAAIADIHAMKRQIHAFRGYATRAVAGKLAGHNIKLGWGGIREIEFFAQTQQLIAGGRQPSLRSPRTLEALALLSARGWIAPAVRDEMSAAYLHLRAVEHRLQMVADEQTHTLPEATTALETFARFCGHATLAEFSRVLAATLEIVQKHYAALFEASPQLTAEGVNMVFAGVADDPATVAALREMGYSQPLAVLAAVRGWHHGRTRAIRSPAARERLTEVQPLLIAALAKTADPDGAFASFDRFLADLPAGVQLFSLLRANPALLKLIADIMGTAPRLARILSRRRRLLDAVIDPRTLDMLPTAVDLDTLLAADFADARDLQEVLDRARVFGGEQAFLIGVRVLSGVIDAAKAGETYALLAERLIAALQGEVETDMAGVHGRVPGGSAAVLAMGKLGGREMTAASDLDLILIYDCDPEAPDSTGARPLASSHYYGRLTQRLINALSAPTSEGSLYEVDMRLRPSGQKGPVATQLTSFHSYQTEEAWTWEHLALTRARVITGPPELTAKVEAVIREVLSRPRDAARIGADVREMRELIWKEKGTDNIWDLKQVRGGLVDLEFTAQYLQLVHAAHHPGILDPNTLAAFQKATAAGVLAPHHADALIGATKLFHDLTQILRLCLDGPFDPAAAPAGLKDLLARAGEAPGFSVLEARLVETLSVVRRLFAEIVL